MQEIIIPTSNLGSLNPLFSKQSLFFIGLASASTLTTLNCGGKLSVVHLSKSLKTDLALAAGCSYANPYAWANKILLILKKGDFIKPLSVGSFIINPNCAITAKLPAGYKKKLSVIWNDISIVDGISVFHDNEGCPIPLLSESAAKAVMQKFQS